MNRRHWITLLATVVYIVVMLAHTHLFLREPPANMIPTNPPTRTVGMAVFVLSAHAAGMTLLGGGAIYLLLRFGLVTPAALVGLFTAWSLMDQFTGDEFTGLYMGWWFFFVAPVAIAAIVEYGVRRWFQFYPPEPLV